MASSRGLMIQKTRDFSKVKKTNDNFKDEFWRAFYYAHYEFSNSELKKEVVKYLKNLKSPLLSKIKDVDESKLSSIGKFCYIVNNGGDLIDDSAEKLLPSLQKIIEHYSKVNTPVIEEEPKIIVNVQDRIKEKAREVASEINGWIDDFCTDKKTREVSDFTHLFNSYGLKKFHMKYLKSFFEKDKQELADVATGDPQLKEGYSNFSKPELRWFNQFYENLFKATDSIASVTTTKKKKRKKPLDLNKVVSKLKYQKEDTPLGLVSLNPVNIIGSKELWVYNTKTRRLGRYIALDEAGLNVKGTSILNFSTKSVEKILRKPPEVLTAFKKITKAKLHTFLDTIPSVEIKLKARLNDFCIIIRVEK